MAETTVTQEEMQQYMADKKAAGVKEEILYQIRRANMQNLPREIFELLAETPDFEVCEAIRLFFHCGVPLTELSQYTDKTMEQVAEMYREYLYKDFYLAQENREKEVGARLERKLQKLEMLVERSESIEQYLKVVLVQKDKLIANQDRMLQDIRQEKNAVCEQSEQLRSRVTQLETIIQEMKIRAAAQHRPEAIVEEKDSIDQQEEEGGIGKRSFCKRFLEKRRSAAVMEYIKNTEWSGEQMQFLVDCLEDGMTLKEIKAISDPKKTVAQMSLMRKVYETRKKGAQL